MCVLRIRRGAVMEKKRDHFKEVMEILDQYYEGTPKKDSKFDDGGE